MNNYSTMETIDLTQELQRIGREISRLTADNRTPASSVEEIVQAAEREQRLAELHRERLAIGGVLLEREKQQKVQEQQRLRQSRIKAAAVAKDLLDRLPSFAERLHQALVGLSKDWIELVKQSQQLQQLDTMFLNKNISSPIGGSLLLEPAALQSLVKRELVRTFGDGVARYQVDLACQIDTTLLEEVALLQKRVSIEGDDHDDSN